ncbi:MAG: hypothetical protein EXS49_02750 [Candidatus Pacebacteria bacterium]|nr:hypothetical protein [Candidatus Paceibacterota bacterium]
MKFISHLIFLFLVNLGAILLVEKLTPLFVITGGIIELAKITGALTLINLILKPIIKFLLSPIIILTFGLATVLINLGILIMLDFMFQSLTITGIYGLIYSTIVIGLVNFLINFSAHHLFNKSI